MSASPATLTRPRHRSRLEEPATPRTRRTPSLTVTGFVLLAVLGVVRWQTMLAHPPVGRMLGLVALALAILLLAPGVGSEAALPRAIALLACVVAGLAMIPMAGLPLEWWVHLRVALLVRAIGHGLSQLPGVIVPYRGHLRDTRAVITLGAALLLIGSSLTLAASRRPRGRLRLAAAALPLLVLAIVPSALARPQFAVLHGALLFGLLALFVFSEQLRVRRGLGAGVAILASILVTMALSPRLEPSRPVIHFETIKVLGGPGTGARGEAFDWAQTYGPLVWPHTGGTVLDVRARFPYYWKAETLDVFDGHGWVVQPVGSGDPYASVSAAARRAWEQTLSVTVRGMRTSNVIAGGIAAPPRLPGGAAAVDGDSPGTYLAPEPLSPGARYDVRVYTPQPSTNQLAAGGTDYPAAIRATELELALTPGGGRAHLPLTDPAQTYRFAPYGTPLRVVSGLAAGQVASPLTPVAAERQLADSAWGPALALAQRLEASTTTPFGYVESVLRYLGHGFTYSQSPPVTPMPILDFLLGHRTGYCQQFAGAMALLLRMGGVPARVAAGFATGQLSADGSEYVVTDIDAHAWVEAFFTGIGWVKFDPTPAADPALAGSVPPVSSQSTPAPPNKGRHAPSHRRSTVRRGNAVPRARAGRGGGSSWLALLAIVLGTVALGTAGVALVMWGRRPAGAVVLLAELETAFSRCGRPLPDEVTLAALERRFASDPAAATYVRSLAAARYAASAPPPTAAGRRAVRRRLAQGLGALGWLRAVFAIPPRFGRGLG